MFTDNAYVTILLCSYLGVKDGNYKPYTALQWSELGYKIINSNIEEPANLLNKYAGKKLIELLTYYHEEQI